jgi:hypothetical protein
VGLFTSLSGLRLSGIVRRLRRIRQGLRADEALLGKPEIQSLRDTLKRHGVADEVISETVAEIILKRA